MSSGVVDTLLLDNRGPTDLPQVASLPDVRRIAETLPAGFYPAESLARNIVRGLENNDATNVAPESSQEVWQMWRTSPDTFLAGQEANYEMGD